MEFGLRPQGFMWLIAKQQSSGSSENDIFFFFFLQNSIHQAVIKINILNENIKCMKNFFKKSSELWKITQHVSN